MFKLIKFIFIIAIVSVIGYSIVLFQCSGNNSCDDVNVEVISGKREAELIYKGVRQAISFIEEPFLIMDIGGGSVEFIIADNERVLWLESFEIGAQRLMEEFHTSDPIKNDEIIRLNAYLTSKLKSLWVAIDRYSPEVLAGSSGLTLTNASLPYSLLVIRRPALPPTPLAVAITPVSSTCLLIAAAISTVVALAGNVSVITPSGPRTSIVSVVEPSIGCV